MKIPSSNSFKIITFFLFMVVGTTCAQNTKCPFQFLYLFGDGITTDIGNSVRVLPFGPFLPATRYPYGKTYPGRPTGRWSDGRILVDYFSKGIGLPNIKRYMSLDISGSNDGVVFSVDGSTVLDNKYFISAGVTVPPYNIPLNTQINWLKNYAQIKKTVGRGVQLSNSLLIFANIEANDMGYLLAQGRSIQEATSYASLIIQTQVNAAREVIKLGAMRVIYSTFGPLGCYPYILTALFTNNPTAYDELGCLKAVNDVIVTTNAALTTAFEGLKAEFPTITIIRSDFYTLIRTVINQTSVLGSSVNPALVSCCGIGGRYNYDKKRFCGSPNVPACPNPENYVFWDGLHFTQETHRRFSNIVRERDLLLLNCTTT